jgi:hypothetical protein
MKIFKQLFFISLVALLMSGCKKEDSVPLPITYSNGNIAKLKVVYVSSYNIRDSIQLKINDVRVSNAFLLLTSTNTPTPFPGGGLNTGGSNFNYYLDLTPGDTRIQVSVPKKLSTVDSILRFSGNMILEAGKTYSAYITDTLYNTKLVLVTENLTPPADNTSRFRFLNLMPNQPLLDLYWSGTKVASNVIYGSQGVEFVLPSKVAGQWAVRTAGASPTSTPLAVYTTTTTGFVIGYNKIMTIFAKGYSGGTGSRTPTVSLVYN